MHGIGTIVRGPVRRAAESESPASGRLAGLSATSVSAMGRSPMRSSASTCYGVQSSVPSQYSRSMMLFRTSVVVGSAAETPSR